jgi:hypothetical protein
MRRCKYLVSKYLVSAICASLVALVLVPDGARAEPGAKECLAAPSRTPEDGRHWYFHTDRTTNQKCWYLRDRDAGTTGAVTVSAGAPPDAMQPGEPRAQAAQRTAVDERAERALFHQFMRWYKEHGATQ